MQKRYLCFLLIAMMLLLSACAGSTPEATENTSSPTEAPAVEEAAEEAEEEHAEAEEEHAEAEEEHAEAEEEHAEAEEEHAEEAEEASAEDGVPVYENWDEVLAAADGTTINWFMWGGSEKINTHVNDKIGGPLQELYGLTLNQVPLGDTADAVNKVLNEKAAGQDSGGSIDAIWINGENFRTLREADLLYGPFTQLLPNSELVDWDNPAINRDFGVSVDGYESPWASFQIVMEHNSATVENPPRSFEDLRDWVKENPGRFTYPGLPNHVGGGFVRQLFYWAAGSPDPFLQPFDQAAYDEYAPVVWEYLNEIKPHLWREGTTYPELSAMPDLLANQEIDFAMEYNSSRASNFIEEGNYPESIRTYLFKTGSLANVSYIAIPYNANNPAGAMILANHLVSADYQLVMTDPRELGWKMAIDPTRLSDEQQATLAEIPYGIATLPADELSAGALPEADASWVSVIEEGWTENVLQNDSVAEEAEEGDAEEASAEDGVALYENWDEVLAAADGTTVNWFMWGGSEKINTHVNEKIGGPLQELYGLTLNQVPLGDTADAVNKVLNEKAAGQDSGGSIDAIWINGENFRTLREADLLYGPFTQLLPNSELVDWDNPAINRDFGVSVDGYESPWASFQIVMEHNSATVENPPRSFEELRDWVKENPGRFTYPGLPNHVGGGFIRQLFYWAAGSPDPFLEPFDQAAYDEYAPVVWDYLNEIKPHLWREGTTYPELSAMPDLLANQEIDFAMEYNSSRASNFIEEGNYPESIRTYLFKTGSLANVSYIAIPYNANNPAGAMILANHLVSADYQLVMTDPRELGWKMAIDPTRLSDEQQATLAEIPYGVATLPADELSAGALPEADASWVSVIEEGWTENVLQK